ncbi:MAG: sulfate ABC transporter permease subunit CysT [Deltaproteobacteria bacterium]|nr:sulfate ABC transporter permease subunit CysT [Deltaproteobacteria bacterium]
MLDINRRILPGFGLSLGYTLLYMNLLVLIPIAVLAIKASQLSWSEFSAAVFNERAIAAYQLTMGASFLAALVNLVIGLLIAWVLVRYRFPGKQIFDALVDLPFALPTAVAGLVYSSLYVKKGWLGQFLVPLGFQGAYSRTAVVLVLIFVSFPFVVRTVQPVIEDLDADMEEAAACLGANRLQTFTRVILPTITPALITGFALAFARAIGEYGSVVFVSGNMPYKTEIAPVLVVSNLEAFQYKQAAAVAVALLVLSFSALVAINVLERWARRKHV